MTRWDLIAKWWKSHYRRKFFGQNYQISHFSCAKNWASLPIGRPSLIPTRTVSRKRLENTRTYNAKINKKFRINRFLFRHKIMSFRSDKLLILITWNVLGTEYGTNNMEKKRNKSFWIIEKAKYRSFSKTLCS